MNEVLNRFVDGIDFVAVHTVLALYGGLITIYVMQKTRYEAEDHSDPRLVRAVRTVALAALSGSMFWSLTYSEAREWMPWPPDLLGILALDVLMTVRVIAIWARIKRTGHYYNAPRMQTRSRSSDR